MAEGEVPIEAGEDKEAEVHIAEGEVAAATGETIAATTEIVLKDSKETQLLKERSRINLIKHFKPNWVKTLTSIREAIWKNRSRRKCSKLPVRKQNRTLLIPRKQQLENPPRRPQTNLQQLKLLVPLTTEASSTLLQMLVRRQTSQ